MTVNARYYLLMVLYRDLKIFHECVNGLAYQDFRPRVGSGNEFSVSVA